MTAARTALLEHFRWSSGHADVWRVFADGDALAAVVGGLADPWRAQGVTRGSSWSRRVRRSWGSP